jgi:hypothetical protein
MQSEVMDCYVVCYNAQDVASTNTRQLITTDPLLKKVLVGLQADAITNDSALSIDQACDLAEEMQVPHLLVSATQCVRLESLMRLAVILAYEKRANVVLQPAEELLNTVPMAAKKCAIQ